MRWLCPGPLAFPDSHFGATIATEGMVGAPVEDLDQAARILSAEAGKVGRPIADFVVGSGLSHGVFIVAGHEDSQRDALAYYKMGPGPHYTLVRPNILVHLEMPKTIRRMLNGGNVLLDNSANPELSLAAIAKRDLQPGDFIANGIGSFDVRGHAVRIQDHPDHIPIGLVRDVTVSTPISRGELLNGHNVEVPDSLAQSLWTRILGDLVAR